jgi:uncharacterized protein (TIGR02145 family)
MEDGAGTNTSGFTALFAGFRGPAGGFFNLGGGVFFWSSLGIRQEGAYVMELWFNTSYIHVIGAFKGPGFSIRCLKD